MPVPVPVPVLAVAMTAAAVAVFGLAGTYCDGYSDGFLRRSNGFKVTVIAKTGADIFAVNARPNANRDRAKGIKTRVNSLDRATSSKVLCDEALCWPHFIING